jgi:hypothetical protein
MGIDKVEGNAPSLLVGFAKQMRPFGRGN